MKNKFKIISFLFALIGFSACEIHDPVADWAELGQKTPYVVWELGSTTVNAGKNVSFTAYYYADGKDISKIGVWYDVNRLAVRSVTCPLISYTFTISADEVMRSTQQITDYDPAAVEWDTFKRSYILAATFPVSQVLAASDWKDVKRADFTMKKFESLYTDTFETAFRKGLGTEISKDYYTKMRKLVEGLSLMEKIEDYDALFTVSKDPATGKDVYKIKNEADKLMLDQKLAAVPFIDLIYNSSGESYSVDYKSSFYLKAEFRAYDTDNVMGQSENKVISII